MAATSTRRKIAHGHSRLDRCAVFGGASNATPSSGAKSTATNQETMSAMLTTAKIEKVYSPAELAAKPIGTKPAMVTNDAGEHGKRQRLVGERRGLFLASPAASRVVMASIVVMASSTSRASAMISAPSEMRCRSMPTNSMTGNTIASVSGIDSATTAPARTPRLTKLTAMMIAIACHSEVMNSPIAPSDHGGLVGHQRRLDADRQVGGDVVHGPLHVAAERQDVAAVAHGDGEADRRLAVDAEHGLRRIDVAAPDLGDVAQPDQAAVDGEVDGQDVLLGVEGAGDAQREPLVAGLERAGRTDHVLRLQRGDQTSARSMPSPASFSVENSTKIVSSWAPRISILDTSGTCSSRARTSST